MARGARLVPVLVALAVTVAGCGSATVKPHRAVAPSTDLAAARAGVADARAWWDPHRGWYDQYLPATGHRWRATLPKWRAAATSAGDGSAIATASYALNRWTIPHRPRYLALARRYIAWADRTIRAPDGLYGARSSPRRPMP